MKTNPDRYEIEISDEKLEFRQIALADPVPLGRQILAAAGIPRVEDYSLFALLPSGDFEDLRLDETFDIRGRGVERFVYFLSDRDFKFTIDNRQLEWGKPLITGKLVRSLAKVQACYSLYLEVRGGQDVEVTDAQIIDLSKAGIERFITVIKATTEGQTALPSMDRTYLDGHAISHEMVEEKGHLAVILKAFPLPADKYDHASADVLIILPSGYPDAPPDMFFLDPWVRLKATGNYPLKADVAHQSHGRTWQRWSRHNDQWRPGVDGLHTMVARAKHAMEVTT